MTKAPEKPCHRQIAHSPIGKEVACHCLRLCQLSMNLLPPGPMALSSLPVALGQQRHMLRAASPESPCKMTRPLGDDDKHEPLRPLKVEDRLGGRQPRPPWCCPPRSGNASAREAREQFGRLPERICWAASSSRALHLHVHGGLWLDDVWTSSSHLLLHSLPACFVIRPDGRPALVSLDSSSGAVFRFGETFMFRRALASCGH